MLAWKGHPLPSSSLLSQGQGGRFNPQLPCSTPPPPNLITVDMPCVFPGLGETIQGLDEPQPSLHYVQALRSQQAAILPGQQLSLAGRALHPLLQGVSRVTLHPLSQCCSVAQVLGWMQILHLKADLIFLLWPKPSSLYCQGLDPYSTAP